MSEEKIGEAMLDSVFVRLSQIFGAFAHGAGGMAVGGEVILAARDHYARTLKQYESEWSRLELGLLESARAMGRLAAEFATIKGSERRRLIITNEEYQAARDAIAPPVCVRSSIGTIDSHERSGTPMRWWIWTLVAIGWLKIAVALPGYAFVEIPLNAETPFPAWVYAANLAIFGACGSLLLVGGRRDPRAQLLGAVWVPGQHPSLPIARLPACRRAPPPWLLAAAEVMRGVEPGAFRSVLAWLFASTFPRDALSGFWRRLASFSQVVSGLVGTMLFAIGLVQLVLRIATTEATAAVASQPLITNQNGIWRLNTALTLAAIPLVLLNARAAGLAERRRVRLFVWALALGAGPIRSKFSCDVLVPPYGALMDRQFPRFLSGMIFYPLLWTGLGVAAYSVYAAEVLTVRLVVRRAIRYAFARRPSSFAYRFPSVAFSGFSTASAAGLWQMFSAARAS